MTDRVRTLTVYLDQDLYTDDAKVMADAIMLMRNVTIVEPGPVVTISDDINRRIIRIELLKELMQLLKEKK